MIEISKSETPFHQIYLTEALSLHHSSVLRIPIWDNGDRIGEIEKRFLLTGMLGLTARSAVVIGVLNRGNRYEIQQYNLNDSFIVDFLQANLSYYPGIKFIKYEIVSIANGQCCFVEINWDINFSNSIRRSLGVNYKPRYWNRFYEDNVSGSDYHESMLTRYVNERKLIDPDAVEIRFNSNKLPTLLNFEIDADVRSAAVAAFGSNGAVKAAIYVRNGVGLNINKSAGDLTHGTHRERYKNSNQIAIDTHSGSTRDVINNESWNKYNKPFPDHSYELGTGVFNIIENASNNICKIDELFSNEHPCPEQFDEQTFGVAIRELIVNGFCHGHWEVWPMGRDDEWDEAYRIAIVHLGDRIEIVNRTRITGITNNYYDYEVAARLSPLHVALKDINLAKGRSIGQKFVRNRLFKIGMPSPIFIRSDGYYRSILPFRNEFSSLAFIDSNDPADIHRVALMFGARLAISLTHLSVEVIASVFYTSREKANKILSDLNIIGILENNTLLDPLFARDYITKSEMNFELHQSETYLSPGAIFQVSMLSMMNLVHEDKSNSIKAIYDNEILSANEAQKHASIYMQRLSKR